MDGKGAGRKRAILRAGVVLTAMELLVVARRRGRLLAADTIVRCRDGHLFTTLWIPGASVKSLRLGWWRFQRCPVDGHWTLVTPAQVSELTEAEKQSAAEHHDIRVP